jgi:two-component system LytT family response regulator
MIKALLIDDEINSLEALGILINKYCPQIKVAGQCNSGREGLKAIEENAPELLFLDIEMPGMSGFEMLEQIPGDKPDVIFVTAYDHYAINAIRISAMDYLLKPVDEEELVKAVQKAEERIRNKESSKQLEVLLTNIKGVENGFQKLAIPTLEGLNFVDIKDIIYCAADGNYTTIVTKGGTKHIISKTLKDTEDMLDHPAFFRTHQSFLVNLNYIKQYIKGSGGQLILQDGTNIQVARARKEALLKLIYK